MGFAVRTPGNTPSPTAGTRQHISSRSTQPATRCEFGVDLVAIVSTIFQKARPRAGWCAQSFWPHLPHALGCGKRSHMIVLIGIDMH